jgi:EAL domain-containing protein (putative c-di-GMP-specific phosphodiesterase class I)
VTGSTLDGRNREILRTITTLAGNLGMDVVAEGVETEDQLARLRDLPCELGQGWLFAEALDPEEASILLRA